jgi:CopG family transcriptional regulator, nickel-responsive regulator
MQRFTISLDDSLAGDFDRLIAERGYGNRSEAVRDLLRGQLDRQRERADPHTACVACLSYVYNHHERELAERLVALQHEHHDLTVSAMHAHLDHDHCIETVILRGPAVAVRRFADAMTAERGVHHGALNLVVADVVRPQAHRHGAVPPGESAREPTDEPTSAGDAAHPHIHLKPRH